MSVKEEDIDVGRHSGHSPANQDVTSADNIDESPNGRVFFYVCVILLEVIGVIALVLVISWATNYFGGFAWDGSGKEFNYHPVFMILGLVVFSGNASIIYRVLRYQEKKTVKIIHGFLHLCGFIFAVLGLVAVFDFHNANNIPNLYSLHSWFGIGTVCLFACQLLFGFLCFLFPQADEGLRRQYLKVHVYFGMGIMALTIISIVSGITEKMLFSFKAEYSKFVAVGNTANVMGVMTALFAMMVGYLLYNPSYKRQERYVSID